MQEFMLQIFFYKTLINYYEMERIINYIIQFILLGE